MLRKIDTHLLQPGMFLQELCGTWIDHPFWRTSFKLKDAGEIAKIINSGIKEALIDTASRDSADSMQDRGSAFSRLPALRTTS